MESGREILKKARYAKETRIKVRDHFRVRNRSKDLR